MPIERTITRRARYEGAIRWIAHNAENFFDDDHGKIKRDEIAELSAVSFAAHLFGVHELDIADDVITVRREREERAADKLEGVQDTQNRFVVSYFNRLIGYAHGETAEAVLMSMQDNNPLHDPFGFSVSLVRRGKPGESPP